MKLSCGERSAPFSIYVVRTDTNRQVLQKLRAAIRQAGLPVEAALHEDAAADTVKLRVTGAQTGSGHSLAIADVYGSAGQAAGILAVTQSGNDALFHIDDGEAVRSESNRVTLDEGKLMLTLHQGSDTAVTVNVAPDEIEARQELEHLALRFNELRASISQASRYLNTLRVHRVLEEAVHLGLDPALHPQPEPPPLSELEPLSEPDLLSEEPPAEKPQPLTSSPWDGIGLRQYADGMVEVDEAALELLLAGSFEQWRSCLRADEGPTRVLVGALNRLLALPAEELLDRRKAAYQAFASYAFRAWGSLRTYLPLPLAGTLVNRQFLAYEVEASTSVWHLPAQACAPACCARVCTSMRACGCTYLRISVFHFRKRPCVHLLTLLRLRLRAAPALLPKLENRLVPSLQSKFRTSRKTPFPVHE